MNIQGVPAPGARRTVPCTACRNKRQKCLDVGFGKACRACSDKDIHCDGSAYTEDKQKKKAAEEAKYMSRRRTRTRKPIVKKVPGTDPPSRSGRAGHQPTIEQVSQRPIPSLTEQNRSAHNSGELHFANGRVHMPAYQSAHPGQHWSTEDNYQGHTDRMLPVYPQGEFVQGSRGGPSNSLPVYETAVHPGIPASMEQEYATIIMSGHHVEHNNTAIPTPPGQASHELYHTNQQYLDYDMMPLYTRESDQGTSGIFLPNLGMHPHNL